MSGGPVAVTGLAAEARIARRAGFAAVIGAGDPARTAALAEAAAAGANCLVSFGIAGGLDPALAPGTIILSGEVIGDDGRWRGDKALLRRIDAFARETGAATGPVFGARHLIASAADKARIRAETGAAAVDLESAVTARAAAKAGIPFVVLRAIADAASHDLPAAALIPLGRDGKPAIGRVLASMLGRPRQLSSLFTLARETRAALAALVLPAGALCRLLVRM